MSYIDVTGKTEDEAIRKALEQLHMDRDDVSVEILERAKSGFLGIGSSPARVRVTYGQEEPEAPAAPVQPEKKPEPRPQPRPQPKPEQPKTRKPEPPKAPVKAPEPPKAAQAPAAAPEQSVLDDNARRITEFLTGLLEHMDSPAQVQVTETEKGRYSVVLEGQKLGQLIGRRGETLDAIQQLTGELPLVLHGGTGIPADMIKKAIDLGVSKINVNTECQLAFAAATRKYIEEGKDEQGKGFDPRKLLAPGTEAIKATVKEKMELFGSVNKA